ncbi:HAD hydrolase-like protein [Ornithinimicrobium sp. CNJ-824]|uniref:HAD hydrolase-like protein n=1 Tax=Ornithinimicrobium sp. CNJ-824 TaxID=1904966 RepID=UPI00096A801D
MHGSPRQRGLTRAAGLLRVQPKDCVYVGDNPHKDFQAARRASMVPIRFRSEFQLHAQCSAEAEWCPDIEVNRLADVLELFR